MPDSRGGPVSLTRLILAVLAIAVFAASGVYAAPAPPTDTTASGATPVRLDKGAISVPVDGAFSMVVDVRLDETPSYLESRIQIRLPSGRLLFQKTEVRSSLATGTVSIEYRRELADLDLEPGAYPIELRVRARTDAVHEWIITDRLLVHDPDAKVPLVVVAHVDAAPSTDATGRFVLDPGRSVRARDDLRTLCAFVIAEPRARLSVAIPPYLLEEWLRASQGYELADPDGVKNVPSSDPVARECLSAISLLKQAVATERLELLNVPFSAPDLGALEAADRLADLEPQFSRGLSAYLAAAETSPSAGTALPGNCLSDATWRLLAARGIEYAFAGQSSLGSTEATLASGVYALSEMAPYPRAIVTDDASSASLASSDDTAVVDAVFARSASEEATVPVALSVELGPGRQASAGAVVDTLSRLLDAAWVSMVTPEDATRNPASEVASFAPACEPAPGAPAGYWAEVAQARAYAFAFLTAVGVNDPEARAAEDASLLAQSRSWAGPDLNWGSVDRGRAFAAAAMRDSSAVLDTIEIGALDVTLSSASGEVPVSITNGSDKNLMLTLKATADGMRVTRESQDIRVRPQENPASVPVDLQSALSGTLEVELWADGLLLDTARVRVRASYLDRLAIVGGVAVVLAGMLLFIRHRIRSADAAGSIESRT